MSDLISRESVIEIIESVCSADDSYWMPDTLEKIRNLPTHTTQSNTLGALDCVSREDLTREIETYFGDLPIAVHYDMLALAQKLPSVQPKLANNSQELENKNGELISRQEAIDAMCWACGHDCDKSKFVYNAPQDEQVIMCPEHYALSTLPSAQPETAKRIVGKSRNGMTLWYQCNMCNEPVDVQDNYCRGCGRRLIDE